MSNSSSSDKGNLPETVENQPLNKITRYVTRLQHSQLRPCAGFFSQKVASHNVTDSVPFETDNIPQPELNHSPTQWKNKLRLPKLNEENKKLKVGEPNLCGPNTDHCRLPLQPVKNIVSRNVVVNMGGGDVVQSRRA